jgi:hypothetical protein
VRRLSRHKNTPQQQSNSYKFLVEAWQQKALEAESVYGIDSTEAKEARKKAASALHIFKTHANTYGVQIEENE